MTTNSSWKRARIGDALRLVNGAAFKPTDWTKDGVPIVRIQNLNNPDAAFNLTKRQLPEKFKLRGGELLFAWSGTPGTSFGAHIWRGGEAWLNQHIFNVLFDEAEWDKKFLQFAINQNLADYIRAAHGGAGLAHITKGRFEESELLQPSPDEQRRIVAEIEKQFTRLDAGVAALRRVQANLKRYRAAVLKAACEGKLVPTEAELVKMGNWKSKFETGEALLARVLTERRQNWPGRGNYKEPATPDTAGLTPLPQGWTWATFDQISERVTVGFVGSMKHEYVASGVPFLRGQNVRENKFDPEGLLYVSPTFHQKLSKSAIHPGDLAVVRSGSVGVTCVIPDTMPEANCSDLVLIQRPSGFVPQYGAFFMNSLAKRHVEAGKVGVALTHFNTKSVAAMAIPLPPLAEQRRIVAEVERRLSVIEELESMATVNLQRAARLRQSILQKAFAGELVASIPAVQLTDIIPTLKPEHIHQPNSHFARALLSAEIVHRLHIEPTFGRIKHQKIFHLCEHVAQIEEIHGQYHREAAGPLDNRLIYANEAELKKQKWYQEVRRESYGHAYQALAKAGGHRKYVEKYWADKLPTIEKLIELMRKWDTERCEIFCTAYAAWNDLILWGKQTTEDNILQEVLERWHDSKKRFPKDRWLKAIGWMKKEGFVPTGFGKPTSNPA